MNTAFYSLKRKSHRLAMSLILLIASTSLNAQATWNFALPTDGSGSTGVETAKGICTDASGNVYIVGVFNGSTDFNLGAGVNTASVTSGNDGFVASYDKAGNYRWHTVITGTGSDFLAPSGAVCTDGANVWFTGAVNMPGAPQVISGSNTISLGTSATGSDAVVGKLSCSSGAVSWAVTFGGSTSNDGGEGISVDPKGDCYVVGSFGGTFTLNGFNPTSGGGSDLFIAKFNTAGVMIHFAKGGSDVGADMISNGGGICYVPGATPTIVAGGSCAGTGTISYGSILSVAATGSIDAVLLELDTTLNYTNALVLGTAATATDEILGVTYDPFSGGVYIAGYYNGGSITLPGTALMPNSGVQDIMVARYSVTGNNFTWASHAGGTGDDRAQAITADGQGGLLISGYTASAPCTFGGAVSISNSGGLNDLYAARYNTSGTAIWALATGGTGDDQARGVASSVQASPYVQNVYITGNFQNTITFNATTLTADGGNDFFLARLNDLSTPLSATQSQVNLSCNGICSGSGTVVASGGVSPYTYSWSPSGGSGATASSLCAANYTVTITDAASSSITKTLNITQPSAIVVSFASQTDVTCYGGTNGAAQANASGGTGTLTYNWTPGNPAGDGTNSVTGLTAQVYTLTVTDANSCTGTRTFTVTQPTPAVAAANTSATAVQSGTIVYVGGCTDLIATVLSNSSNPIAGSTTAKVWIDGVQPAQYVKRHYEITPAANAAAATGRITLYFTQAELDAFNAVSTADLPANSGDVAGKANMLIEKRGGISGDGTGAPISYTGSVSTINPVDGDIVFNSAASRWEVTFDVTGFSGFFIKTQASALPVKWISVSGSLNDNKQAMIYFTVEEANVNSYTVEKSADASSFASAGTLSSKGDGSNSYAFTDAAFAAGKGYYRIKQEDKDGRFSYSPIIRLANRQAGALLIYPQPVKSSVTIGGLATGSRAVITDITGRVMQVFTATAPSFTVDMSRYNSGTYLLRTDDGKAAKIIKQ